MSQKAQDTNVTNLRKSSRGARDPTRERETMLIEDVRIKDVGVK